MHNQRKPCLRQKTTQAQWTRDKQREDFSRSIFAGNNNVRAFSAQGY